MKSIYKITLIFILSLASCLAAYAVLPTGQWRTHMSYVKGTKLAISENKVYCLASGSLFSYGLQDDYIEIYTKVSGLNDVYINDIAFCDKTQTLVICYVSGNIDLMNADGVINVPDIKLKPMYGSKNINKVNIYDGMAYLSADFGVVKLNIEKAEISETYVLTNSGSNPANGTAILGENIYVATNDGLYSASLNSPNLQNFAEWEKATDLINSSLPIVDIAEFNGQIIVAQYNSEPINDSKYLIYRLDNSQWELLVKFNYFKTFGVSDEIFSVSSGGIVFNINKSFGKYSELNSYSFASLDYPNQNTPKPNNAICKNNILYVADDLQGLVVYETGKETLTFKPDGPASNLIWDIDIKHNILRTVHGAHTQDYNNTWTNGAFSTMRDDRWTFVSSLYGGPNYKEYVAIETDPVDPEHFFIGSFGYGVLEFLDDKLENAFNEGNSSLESAIPGNNKYIRTLGLAYDDEDNLYVSTGGGGAQVQVFTSEREWYPLESKLTIADDRYTQIAIVDNQKWVAAPFHGKGILVYDDNATFFDKSDDKEKYFSVVDGSEVVAEKVYTIEKDKDDAIWVGSNNGVAVYYNTSKIFDISGIPEASRILIPRNDGTGNGDYLLDGETIYDIVVDGGNRKWIATGNSGVYLVSPDGKTQIYHFTKDNSSLLSDNVRTIEINNETGEVYFGTELGLISFQADATEGNENFSNIKVYPNPAREDYFGDITITGLVDETIVKVTDVSGNLVHETISNGGTATWNCKNFYGERVGTGVYLIFCSDKKGEKSAMTKVMVIN